MKFCKVFLFSFLLFLCILILNINDNIIAASKTNSDAKAADTNEGKEKEIVIAKITLIDMTGDNVKYIPQEKKFKLLKTHTFGNLTESIRRLYNSEYNAFKVNISKGPIVGSFPKNSFDNINEVLAKETADNRFVSYEIYVE